MKATISTISNAYDNKTILGLWHKIRLLRGQYMCNNVKVQRLVTAVTYRKRNLKQEAFAWYVRIVYNQLWQLPTFELFTLFLV